VVLQCGIAVYLLSRATLPDMLLPWCTHRPSSPSTLRLHSKTETAGSNVNGLLLRSFELLLQARMATKAAAASPGRDRAPASTSEGRPVAGTARVDQGRQARRPPANRHEAAKNQQKHRPTKQRTPQGCVVESAAVVPPDPAEGWKEEPPERVARKKTPPERNARKKTPLEGGSTGEDGAGVDAGGEGEVSQKGSGTKGRGCHSYSALSLSSSSSLWGC
jgi:hypothetical protein